MTNWVVLAGGRGSRYGQPKIFAEFGDGTFLSHCLKSVGACAQAGDRIIVSVAGDDAVEGVTAARKGANIDGAVKLSVVTDTTPEAGPAHAVGAVCVELAGNGGHVIMFAVDMLGIRSVHLDDLRSIVSMQRPDQAPSIVVARHGAQRHWTLAAIPAGLVDKVARDAESVSSLQSLFQLNPITFFDVGDDALLDVNTPELKPPLGTEREG